jgi:hypothetical protein
MAGFRVSIVRDELGLLTISPEVSSAARQNRATAGVLVSRLAVSGGELATSIDDTRLRITARIDDYPAARGWVESLYGGKVAKSLAAVNSPDEIVTRTVAAKRPKLAKVVGRLLLGLWLRHWRPTAQALPPLEQWVLDAELGSLAWRSRDVTGNLDLAAQLLESRAVIGGLTHALETLLDHPGTDPEANRFSRMIMKAARATVDVLPADDPNRNELEAAHSAVLARESGSSAAAKRLIDWASELASAPGTPIHPAVTRDVDEDEAAGGGGLPDDGSAIAERVLRKRRKAVSAGDLSGARAPFAFETYGERPKKSSTGKAGLRKGK